MNLAPIVLFTYNRLWHTKETLDSLLQNPEASKSKLYIYTDAAADESEEDKVADLRQYLYSVRGFLEVKVIEQSVNQGLSKSILNGVSEILEDHSKVIVLEDDLRCSPFFLRYMNEGLERYEMEDQVACVHAYCYPIVERKSSFFLKGSDCWGWGTWKSSWDSFEKNGSKLLKELEVRGLCNIFDFNGAYPYTKMLRDQIQGKNNSWAVRWKASTFLKDQLCLYYKQSLVQNIGNDNSGTHSRKTDVFQVEFPLSYDGIGELKVEEDQMARKQFEDFYRSIKPTLIAKINAKLKSIWR